MLRLRRLKILNEDISKEEKNSGKKPDWVFHQATKIVKVVNVKGRNVGDVKSYQYRMSPSPAKLK